MIHELNKHDILVMIILFVVGMPFLITYAWEQMNTPDEDSQDS